MSYAAFELDVAFRVAVLTLLLILNESLRVHAKKVYKKLVLWLLKFFWTDVEQDFLFAVFDLTVRIIRLSGAYLYNLLTNQVVAVWSCLGCLSV